MITDCLEITNLEELRGRKGEFKVKIINLEGGTEEIGVHVFLEEIPLLCVCSRGASYEPHRIIHPGESDNEAIIEDIYITATRAGSKEKTVSKGNYGFTYCEEKLTKWGLVA